MGICGAFWRENVINGENYLSVIDTAGPLDVPRVVVLPGVPERASGGRGWLGSGWIKGLFRGKTRNQRRG
jgi:hypothetical protein